MDAPKKILIEQTSLENRAILQLYDASRIMAGDKMLVTLLVRIEIPVESLGGTKTAYGLPPAEEIRVAIGDPVAWEYRKQRMFIDIREKEEVFEKIRAEFDANMRPYLLHPDFPAGFVKKQLEKKAQAR